MNAHHPYPSDSPIERVIARLQSVRKTAKGFRACCPAPGHDDRDPSLDIDDTNGFGPENINVNIAGPGSYAFGASYFSGSVPVAMFVRLFLFGRLAGEWVQTVDSDFFEVGIVHFTAEEPFRPCVEDLTDGNSSDQCPGF